MLARQGKIWTEDETSESRSPRSEPSTAGRSQGTAGSARAPRRGGCAKLASAMQVIFYRILMIGNTLRLFEKVITELLRGT